MDGNQLLMQMKHLGEVESIKDVRPLTAAMFPGTHCPLMGAAMAVRGISDAMMLIIGTDECTYYTKHFSVHAENFGGLNGRCVSVALDGHDVTFGCVQKGDRCLCRDDGGTPSAGGVPRNHLRRRNHRR